MSIDAVFTQFLLTFMISAYAAANKVVLGQLKTAKKSNEITAIPELLTLLYIKGGLVSIDAIGCQTHIQPRVCGNRATTRSH